MNTDPKDLELTGPLRILHLEDNPHDHRLVQEWLKEKDFATEITAVNSMSRFVEALEQKPFDLILSDKSLPDCDGLAALRFCKEKHSHLPFVFVTGSMGEEAAIETMKEGATDYVLKDGLKRLIPAVERAIRESKQAEKNRQAEEKIREQAALIDTAQEAIMVKDVDDHILFWNKSAERIYGWPASEIIGRKPTELLTKDLAKYEEAKQHLFANGNWTGELIKVNREGAELIVESRWTLMRDAKGQPKSILTIDADITDKKSLEAQFLRSQRLESIGSLASGIAHDLNNCLSPIMMGVAVLKDMVPDPSMKKILDAMESSAMRGAGVVKQVLTFARGSTGEQVVLQPNHLIQEMVKIMRETFPRSIQITTECAPNLWSIEGDPTQIHQVLLNLCVNARDAMPDGGNLTLISENVTLADPPALVGLSGPPGPYVRIDVKDTGTGIPPEIQQKIFQPFFTTKDVGKGTGLGLSTTVSILTTHHGLLGLQSSSGAGTTFSLYFPSKADVMQLEDQAKPRRRTGRQDMILLVDDEAAIREMCKFLLESCNYRVLTAENGAQALALFQLHKDELALVVTDSNMPIMGGTTAVRAMRWSVPQLKIIATSGGGAREDEILAADPTSYRFLPKPYTAERLLNLIHDLMPHGDTAIFHKPENPSVPPVGAAPDAGQERTHSMHD